MVGISSTFTSNQRLIDWLTAASTINNVNVGYPDELAYPNGTKVGAVAAFQEFGTARIPPRPFIRPTIASRSGHWFRKVRDGLTQARNASRIMAMYEDLGKGICVNLQTAIDRVSAPPLAESTKERRRARGNNSTKPLIDTRVMRDSLSYRVGEEGDWKR